jgi:hypothetical protein
MRSIGVVGSANGSKALADLRRDVGVSLRDRSEHLPASGRSFDIPDADLQVPFALFAAADEPRVHADSERCCCRRCWPAGPRLQFQAARRSAAYGCAMSQGPYRRQQATGIVVRQRLRRDRSSRRKDEPAVGPAQVSIGSAMANRGSSRCDCRRCIETKEAATVTSPNSVPVRCPRQSFRWHFPLQAGQHAHCSPCLSASLDTTAR